MKDFWGDRLCKKTNKYKKKCKNPINKGIKNG